MKLRPGYNRILVVRDERRKKTEGGILLPDQLTFNDSDTGTVDAVFAYEQKFEELMEVVEIGTRVVFAKDAGTPVMVKGKEAGRMLFIPEILAIVEEE